LRTALPCGEQGNGTLPLVQKYVDDIVTVDEEEIANAILLLLEREKNFGRRRRSWRRLRRC